jgi:uncharacterized protein YbaR (Trm112 family)
MEGRGRRGEEVMGDFSTICPYCHKDECLEVISGCFTAQGMRLQWDGFSPVDAKIFNTEDEQVFCNECNKIFPLTDLMED